MIREAVYEDLKELLELYLFLHEDSIPEDDIQLQRTWNQIIADESHHLIVYEKEEIYLHTYQDSREARREIFEYIESWYNRKKIHSAIYYMTPQQKEDM